MTRRALQALYRETLPRRGDVIVELRAASEEDVTGVIASIAGLVTKRRTRAALRDWPAASGARACCDSASRLAARFASRVSIPVIQS